MNNLDGASVPEKHDSGFRLLVKVSDQSSMKSSEGFLLAFLR